MYEGLAPLWKETLDLPFTPPMADFSPANLAQVSIFAVQSYSPCGGAKSRLWYRDPAQTHKPVRITLRLSSELQQIHTHAYYLLHQHDGNLEYLAVSSQKSNATSAT